MASHEFSNKDQAVKLGDSTKDFSLSLYKQLAREKPGENLFFSPFSISTALGMTFLGARGNTARQMLDILKYQPLGEVLHTAFAEHIKLLKAGSENFTLNTANRLFVHDKSQLLETYTIPVKQHYLADILPVNFVEEEKVRQEINNWVDEETASKIKDLLPPGSLSKDTVLVLVNAIYFKGDWLSKFKVEVTQKLPFHVSKNEDIQVHMMHQTQEFGFYIDNELQFNALELPYKGNDLSMIAMLPFEVDGLADLEQKITLSHVKELINKMHLKKVDVSLPKFKLEAGFELRDTLSSMGMTDIFHFKNADLSGIDGSKDLYISSVIHRAIVEVNEEGTEAAAATAVKIVKRSLQVTPRFVADHPFMFCIQDKRSGAVLFMGRFVRPEKMESNRNVSDEL